VTTLDDLKAHHDAEGGHSELYAKIMETAQRVAPSKRRRSKPSTARAVATLAGGTPLTRNGVRSSYGHWRRKIRRTRRRAVAAGVVAKAGVKLGWKAGKITGNAVLHPIRTAKYVICVLFVLIILTPVTFPQVTRGAGTAGGWIMPSGFACDTPTEPLPVGGVQGIAAWAGNLVHQASTAPSDPAVMRDGILGFYRNVGATVQVFRNGVKGLAPPTQPAPAPGSAAAQVGMQTAAACCSGTPGMQAASLSAAGSSGVDVQPAVAVARIALEVFPEDPVHAVAIAGAESGWNPDATHYNNDDHASIDYGIWQVNGYWHKDLLAMGSWRKAEDNAMMARKVYDDAGGSWSPWSTQDSGAWKAYEDRARQAVNVAQGQAGPQVPLDVPGVPPLAQSQCETPGTILASFPGRPGPAQVEAAIRYAMAQRGKPYRYGSAPQVLGQPAPATFDCSSLVDSAYLAAGVDLPGRQTTATLISQGTPVTRPELLRGDVVFLSSGHVGIALDGDTMVVAPQTGDVVKVERIYAFWAARRIVPQVSVTA
jgi:cell wall-associated NlpC family hydrolase